MSTTVDTREIRLRWWGSCHRCEAVLTPDSRAFRDPASHTLTCLACAYADLPPYTPGTDDPVIRAPAVEPSRPVSR